MDFVALNEDVAHTAGIDLGEKLREGDVVADRPLGRVLEQREQRQEQQDDDHPEGEVAQIRVHH